MSAELGFFTVATERVHLPRMTSDTTFHWDGMQAVSPSIRSNMGSAPTPAGMHVAVSFTPGSIQAERGTAMGRHTASSLAAGDLGRAPSSPPSVLDWEREAERLTFYVDRQFLLATARDVLLRATGELVWVRERHARFITLYIHPILLVQASSASLQADRAELVPHLQAGDPLLHHITLVLKAAIAAESMVGCLYAESLTNALAAHFLKRYAACRPPIRGSIGSLSQYKLRRITEYIHEHLEQGVTLTEIAAVAQLSPDHIARLFRQATGQTPHQFMIKCRVERAMRLLAETELPIIDVAHQVGFTDQSYFTAVFRRQTAMTPKTYRDGTQR